MILRFNLESVIKFKRITLRKLLARGLKKRKEKTLHSYLLPTTSIREAKVDY